MTKITPTPEQLAIIEAAATTNDNLIINALAGAAKTSTLVMMARDPRMSKVPILSLAFNKKIAVEMEKRLPANCVAKTLNGLGHGVWARQLQGKTLRLDTRKTYGILTALIKEERQDIRDELMRKLSSYLNTLRDAKASGWVPEDIREKYRATSLIELDDEFRYDIMDEEVTDFEFDIIRAVMRISIEQAYEGFIDFDDQIYMPTLFPSFFQSPKLTLIDEAQDLSPLNHAMLAKMVKSNRIIAVGDPCQAIYAFRGALGNSMSLLADKFSMKEFTLSTSFRCPRAVVEEARWRAPRMQFPEWAKDGSIRRLSDWTQQDVPDNAVILCRNNAPLFSMAIKLLREGRYPEIVGNDIAKQVIKIFDSFSKDKSIPRDRVLEHITDYETKRLSKTHEHAQGKVYDLCDVLRVFCDSGDNLGSIMKYVEYIMNSAGPVKLMTGHKSKGLEFENVFILDRHLLKLKEAGGRNQDDNLLYVMQTRSQDKLTYVDSDEFVMLGDIPEEDAEA